MTFYEPEKPKRDETSNPNYGLYTSAYTGEKPKRGFQSYDYNRMGRERGGCLTAFLVFHIFVNVVLMFMLCSAAAQIDSRFTYTDTGSLWLIVIISLAIGCASIAFGLGLWNWKRWGYYGMVVGYGISIILNLCSSNVTQIAGNVIGLVILISLVNPISEMLE